MDGEIIIVDLNKFRGPYRTASKEDRARIVRCARNGGDLITLANHLNINIKTCRSIAYADRETPMRSGSSKVKFSADYVKALCDMVDANPEFSLRQLCEGMSVIYPEINISKSSVDRLLDGHGYSMKKMTIQPIERNRTDVKMKRFQYAEWLRQSGSAQLRLYIDETNYNIWCSRTKGRSKVNVACARALPSNRGANLNVLACISTAGVLLHECHSMVTWETFNNFLISCSMKVSEEQPGIEAVFIFDNAPVHKRAHEAVLCERHSFRQLPPYSPFFNPIEEAFSKFKQVSSH